MPAVVNNPQIYRYSVSYWLPTTFVLLKLSLATRIKHTREKISYFTYYVTFTSTKAATIPLDTEQD